LHWGNYAADLASHDTIAFAELAQDIAAAGRPGGSPIRTDRAGLKGLRGRHLLDHWREFYPEMAGRFAVADPKQRAPWFGPDMSVLSSITARLMETWAHAQALYDLLGRERVDTDRIRNIAILGVNTFGWTFTNRALPVPSNRPYVRLTAPSGVIWERGEPDPLNMIEGSATEFCQVVAQTRNIADTKLRTIGETATRWMLLAQCFAGPAHDPPPPGTRFRQVH
jgi:uncharacterized protein (TIGR03084 family)